MATWAATLAPGPWQPGRPWSEKSWSPPRRSPLRNRRAVCPFWFLYIEGSAQAETTPGERGEEGTRSTFDRRWRTAARGLRQAGGSPAVARELFSETPSGSLPTVDKLVSKVDFSASYPPQPFWPRCTPPLSRTRQRARVSFSPLPILDAFLALPFSALWMMSRIEVFSNGGVHLWRSARRPARQRLVKKHGSFDCWGRGLAFPVTGCLSAPTQWAEGDH